MFGKVDIDMKYPVPDAKLPVATTTMRRRLRIFDAQKHLAAIKNYATELDLSSEHMPIAAEDIKKDGIKCDAELEFRFHYDLSTGTISRTGSVTDVVELSGGYIASSHKTSFGDDSKGGIKLWQVKTGWDDSNYTCIATLDNKSEVDCLAALPDGRLAAWKGYYANIWNVNTKQCDIKLILDHESSYISKLAVLPNGQLVSYESPDKDGVAFIIVSNVHTGRRVAKLKTSEITALLPLPDGRLAVGQNISNLFSPNKAVIKIWDIQRERCVNEVTVETQSDKKQFPEIRFLTLLSDGRVASYNGFEIRLTNLNTEHTVTMFENKLPNLGGLTALPDGRLFCYSSFNGAMVIDISKNTCVRHFSAPSDNNNFKVLSDGRLVTTGFEKLKLWDVTRTLQFAEIEPLLTAIPNSSVQRLNLQYTDLDDKAIPTLSNLINEAKQLTQLDLRGTKITREGAEALWYLGYKRATPLQVLHEAAPNYYPVRFNEYAQRLNKNPDDKAAYSELLNISELSHKQILEQYCYTLQHPEALTDKLLHSMFAGVCHLADFKFCYTLFNIGLRAGNLQNLDLLRKQLVEALDRLAKNAIFDAHGVATFKQILRSVLRKGIIDKFQSDVFDREAEKSDTFADPRFKELKRQVILLQSQVDVIRADLVVIKGNINALAEDLNQLKEAMKKKADRGFFFGIAKTAFAFIGSGLIDVLEHACDFSDLYELGTAVFCKVGLKPEDFMGLVVKGKAELADALSEKVIKVLGQHQDQFVEEWYQLSIVMQKLNSTTNISIDFATAKSLSRKVQADGSMAQTSSFPKDSKMQTEAGKIKNSAFSTTNLFIVILIAVGAWFFIRLPRADALAISSTDTESAPDADLIFKLMALGTPLLLGHFYNKRQGQSTAAMIGASMSASGLISSPTSNARTTLATVELEPTSQLPPSNTMK